MYQNSHESAKLYNEFDSRDMINDEYDAEVSMDLDQYIDQIVELNGKYYLVQRGNDGTYLNEVDLENDKEIYISEPNNCSYIENTMKIEQNQKIVSNINMTNNQTVMMGNKQFVVVENPEGGVDFQPVVNYSCPDCRKQFNHANSLTKHLLEFHKVKVFVCRQCPKMFPALSELFLHARREHVDTKKPPRDPNNFKFHCSFDQCAYMTNNGGTFQHHMNAHTGEKPFQCYICSKRFTQNANMKTHLNRHITEKVFSCDICNKKFKTHDIYLAHLRTREHELREHWVENIRSSVRVVCVGCNATFTNLFDIRNHSKDCIQNLDYMFKCVQCDEFLENYDTLKRHIKNHKDLPLDCPVCGERGFKCVNQLNHHITRSHNIKVTRKQVCRYCELTFQEETELNEHIKEYHAFEVNSRKSHGAIGRFQCPNESCSFTANTQMLIESHMLQHENGKLDAVKLSPKKRGRKRKLPGMVDMLEFHYDDKLNGDGRNIVGESYKREDSHLQVRRGRGRPKKIGVNSEFTVVQEDAHVRGTEMSENDYNERTYESGKRPRGRPRKTIEVFNYQQGMSTVYDSALVDIHNSNDIFTPYIKNETVEEISDPDCLYV